MEDDSLIRPNALIGIIIIVGLISIPAMIVLLILEILRNEQGTPVQSSRYLVYVILGMGLGYINTTKPTNYSDLGYYYWLYNWAATKSLYEYLAIIPKEPLFYIYNLLMRYVTFGSFPLYIIVTTTLMYVPVMIAFDCLIRKNDIPIKYAVVAAAILACFSEYFFYTAQLIRQVLAGSTAFYFMVRLTYKKDWWSYVGLASAGFIHATAFIFCVFYFLQFTIHWRFVFRAFAILLSFILFGFLISLMSTVIDADTTLAYAVGRIGEETLEKITIGFLPQAVCFSIIPMSIVIMWKLDWKEQISNILLLGIFLVCFVFYSSSNPLFMLRFMEYCYMFIPICLVMALVLLGFERMTYLALVIIFIRFCLVLNKGDFHYDSLFNLFTSGYFSLILKIFS